MKKLIIGVSVLAFAFLSVPVVAQDDGNTSDGGTGDQTTVSPPSTDQTDRTAGSVRCGSPTS